MEALKYLLLPPIINALLILAGLAASARRRACMPGYRAPTTSTRAPAPCMSGWGAG